MSASLSSPSAAAAELGALRFLLAALDAAADDDDDEDAAALADFSRAFASGSPLMMLRRPDGPYPLPTCCDSEFARPQLSNNARAVIRAQTLLLELETSALLDCLPLSRPPSAQFHRVSARE